MDLRRLDLNLLIVFDAVYSERNITRAGARLSMPQPTVSNAVRRLRGALGDELFVRNTSGIEPSERAHNIAGPIRAILTELEEILEPVSFQSHTAAGSISVAAVDIFSTVFLPELSKRLEQTAPGIILRVLPTSGRTFELIDRGEADIGIASFGTPPARFGITKLVRGEYVCVMRQGHPALETRFTPQKYAAGRHILYSPRGDLSGSTDASLAAAGFKRRVVLSVTNFLSAVPILENTDLIMTVPGLVADIVTKSGKLVQIPCPVESETSFRSLEMIWHRRLGNRPLLNWFREVLVGICSDAVKSN